MARAKRASLEDFAAKKPGAEPLAEPEPATAAPAGPRKGQTLRLSVEAWRQLKMMGLEEDRAVHDILLEAVNDAFRKRGKPTIA